ncbi:MAG: NUDIX hydrolase [Patescibacteria group bacterium]|jgi:8-oxo-dGTP diphosphatase
MEEIKRPKVGVGVIIKKDGKILFGKRKNAHGDGTWAPPGGHLEWCESPEECAIRETAEEAGIVIKNLKPWVYTNDFFEKEDKHYVTVYVIAEYESGEPQTMEPDKCEGWDWFDWNDLPRPLFLTTENLLKAGHNPFE